jgi:PhzF family phenazine biosynthesis protein
MKLNMTDNLIEADRFGQIQSCCQGSGGLEIKSANNKVHMNKNYTIYQIDAFTNSKFKGNPAGVVLNAEGLSETQMQGIARELNNSETAFLFPPDDHDCDGVIRYFTPTIEVPTCGHATIAAMYAKATEEEMDPCVLHLTQMKRIF